jgi:hypothetical protein
VDKCGFSSRDIGPELKIVELEPYRACRLAAIFCKEKDSLGEIVLD